MTSVASKSLVVLVGPKGAGKSTIGAFLAVELGIRFLRVEPLFLEVRGRLGASHPEYEQRGFEAVLAALRHALASDETVCFESTGASEHFGWLLSELREVARVHLVRVVATPAQCVERIRGRDASIHIPVSDDDVERVNALAARVVLPWSAEVDNGGAFDGRHVAGTVRRLLEPPGLSGGSRPP